MKLKTIVFLFLIGFGSNLSFGQELNCQVSVDAQQTGKTKLSVFKTLAKSVQEFINDASWTDKKFNENEKINCSIFINVSRYDSDNFVATLQVQSSRPVYGSSMVTPILNYKDEQFSFNYTEHQPLDYNPNQFDSNLVSTISFYVYTILGLDADTFSSEGGTPYYEEARRIVNTAQQSRYAGWKATGAKGNKSRFQLNDDLLSNNYADFRKALYVYHRQGLDVMYDDLEKGKKKVAEAIQLLRNVNNTQPNSLLLRSFFDAKAPEIQQIFSGGPSVSITKVVDNLNQIAPTHTDNWQKISY